MLCAREAADALTDDEGGGVGPDDGFLELLGCLKGVCLGVSAVCAANGVRFLSLATDRFRSSGQQGENGVPLCHLAEKHRGGVEAKQS